MCILFSDCIFLGLAGYTPVAPYTWALEGPRTLRSRGGEPPSYLNDSPPSVCHDSVLRFVPRRTESH